MSLLSTITKGRENRPPRLFVYGQEGGGKSLFSASAPNPIFVQTEDGLGEIDTAKFPLAKSLADVTSAMTALRDEPHDFQTVVLDYSGPRKLDNGLRCAKLTPTPIPIEIPS